MLHEPKLLRKIPRIYLDEFLKQKSALINNRARLAAALFVGTFFTGSLVGTLLLKEEIGPELISTWFLTVAVCILIFFLSGRSSGIHSAKLNTILIVLMVLIVLTRYFTLQGEPPFNVAMTYIFCFLGFSLIFPWYPAGVVGLMLLHYAAYAAFIFNTPEYIFKNNTIATELPDYLQGLIVMFLAFWVCVIVSKREREREIESFVLLKEVEDKNKQMLRELELATRVHRRLVPHSVSTRLADLAVTYRPVYYMGGDYAKFRFIDKNRLIFIISDVTGHGVSAALLVNALNAEFERLAKEEKSPGVLLKEMDRFITRDFAETSMYLTAFCGLLDYKSRKFVYSSYGHPPQYLYRRDSSKVERITSQTSFLGLPLEDENVYESEMHFDKGDQILLFTDGVVEARSIKGEEYGDIRLEAFMRRSRDIGVESFNKKLLSELDSFTAGAFKDDIFVLNILTKGPGISLASIFEKD